MPRISRVVLLALLLFTAGCATAPTEVCDRLFFGRAIPGGGEVTEAQWHAFVTEVIVPRFPQGFTIWRGAGHWKGDDGAGVSEQTCVLEIVHGKDAATDAKLDQIARAYRERFNQDAVLGIRTPATSQLWRRDAAAPPPRSSKRQAPGIAQWRIEELIDARYRKRRY